MNIDVGKTLRQLLDAVIKGELLKKIGADKYFAHVCYVLFLCALAILFSLQIDRRMRVRVSNDVVIGEQRAEMVLQEYELAKFTRRTQVEQMLRDKGSKVGEPRKPAKTLR